MNKQKFLGIVAVAVLVVSGLLVKKQVMGGSYSGGWFEQKVYLEQLERTVWSCEASFDGKERPIKLKFVPGSGVFYYNSPPDSGYFYGGYQVQGRRFRLMFVAMTRVGAEHVNEFATPGC
jgi:hypothetical protein